MRDFRWLTSNAVAKLVTKFREINTVIKAACSVETSDHDAHDIVIRGAEADVKAISHQLIRAVCDLSIAQSKLRGV